MLFFLRMEHRKTMNSVFVEKRMGSIYTLLVLLLAGIMVYLSIATLILILQQEMML